MEILELTLKRVSDTPYESYRLTFAETFNSIVKNSDGENIDGDVDYIYFKKSVFIEQCCDCITELRDIKDRKILKNEKLEAIFWDLFLNGAKLKIERERYKPGDKYHKKDGQEGVYCRCGYNNRIINIELTERGKHKIEKVYSNLISFNIPLFDTGVSVDAYCSTFYRGYQCPGNPDYILILKNQRGYNLIDELITAKQQLEYVLKRDIAKILKKLELDNIVVCVVPRAKAENEYAASQKLFRDAVECAVNNLSLINGTKYIIRTVTTCTTHMSKVENYENEGPKPYRGILKDTCVINESGIRGQDVLLIDDIYTKSVNIDEDALLTLFEKGAKSVTFYAIGYTNRI